MAIPFFEPNDGETTATQHGDQVDGHGDTQAAGNSTTTTSNTLQSVNEQVLAWKILAIAMCKALKDYHQQSISPQEAFTSGNGSIVQVLPNGEVQPLWK